MFDDWELPNDHPVNRKSSQRTQLISKENRGNERYYKVKIELYVVPYKFRPSSAFGPGISDTVIEMREFSATDDVTAVFYSHKVVKHVAEIRKGSVRSMELWEIIQPMIPGKLRSVSLT